MENQAQGKQPQTGSKGSETKKQTNQPSYGDKPWQNPQYGQVKTGSQDATQDESCGCGTSEMGNKKDQGPKSKPFSTN